MGKVPLVPAAVAPQPDAAVQKMGMGKKRLHGCDCNTSGAAGSNPTFCLMQTAALGDHFSSGLSEGCVLPITEGGEGSHPSTLAMFCTPQLAEASFDLSPVSDRAVGPVTPLQSQCHQAATRVTIITTMMITMRITNVPRRHHRLTQQQT